MTKRAAKKKRQRAKHSRTAGVSTPAAGDPEPSPATPSSIFRNRIVGYEEAVDVATITRNPLNWRVHSDAQKGAMTDLLGRLGYVDTCLVNRRTRRLIDGEMRLDIAEANNERHVPVLWVDLTQEEERLALATINPMSELASTDPEQLGKLLADVDREGGPLDELLRSLEEIADLGTVKKAGGASTSKVKREASPAHTVRIVLAVTDVATVERALRATNISNRGDALIEICRSYLADEDHEAAGPAEDAEHVAGPEGGIEDQLAQALAAETGRS